MTEKEYKAKLREDDEREAKKHHKISLFHPVGGRKVVDLKKEDLETLEKLKDAGWTDSPRNFWDEETVLKKIAEGFFNDEHNINPNAKVASGASYVEAGPSPEEIAKAALFTRGPKEQAVPVHSGVSDDRSGVQPGREPVAGSSDRPVAGNKRKRKAAGAKAKTAVVSQAG